jgi:glycosyltransferase involved in cell wall biosynthesis
MSNPSVTVLMPAFNAGRFIAASIRSVLAQDFEDFELLVIDDGSTDETARIAEDFRDERIRLVRNASNQGLVATLNQGLREARALLVARQDADDLCRRDRLARQTEHFSMHPSDAAVASEARLIDETGRDCGTLRLPRTRAQLRWDLCFRNPIPHSSVMMRRETVLSEFGGYPVSTSSEDYALWSAIAAKNRFGLIPRRLVSYRIHSSSAMMSASSMAAAYRIDKSSAESTWALAAEGVGRVRSENMKATLAGIADAHQQNVLLASWANPADLHWAQYVEVFEKVAAAYAKVHGTLGRVPGLEYQTLLSRGAPASAELFKALCSLSAGRIPLMPWHRIAGSALLRKSQ